MGVRAFLIIALFTVLPPSSYSAALAIHCPAVLNRLVARFLPAPQSHAATISRVQERMRALLGPLYSEEPVHVENRTCLSQPGCLYESMWNVIQLDSRAALKDNWTYGVIYAHELTHGVVTNENRFLTQRRQRIVERERSDYMENWARIHKTRRKITTANFFGLGFLFEHAERQIKELSERMENRDNQHHYALGLVDHYERSSRNPIAYDFLTNSSGEL